MKNEGAMLEFAILFTHIRNLLKRIRSASCTESCKRIYIFGNGQFPWGREEVYRIEKDDLYLAGTAEVPVTAYFADEILSEKDLPKKFVAYSSCYRREAGSYGKDTKGVYRVHQFNKVEQVIISTNDLSTSFTLHEELLKNSEEILQDLELPYRVLLMCTGDMGEPQIKKYDVETWMPGRPSAGSGLGNYGETMSNSVMGIFRQGDLKSDINQNPVKPSFVIRSTILQLLLPEFLSAILENYQNEDGSVRVPKVLQPYLGKEIISRTT